MDKNLIESMKGKSREERAEMFKANKDAFLGADDLAAVNGGAGASAENPNSDECPYKGSWVSSFGYICNGEVVC
ncbi:hypothetical protein SAMN02910456_02193 [Ruminococcaceae bacterium YRB3002]|nr:hypothetical protein SAMN02910456_02193 [Ruminococcaceae bacterium YRB3002]